jgi:hypothetical protein
MRPAAGRPGSRKEWLFQPSQRWRWSRFGKRSGGRFRGSGISGCGLRKRQAISYGSDSTGTAICGGHRVERHRLGTGKTTVVPGNPDLVDTLRVEPPPFLHTTFYVGMAVLTVARDCFRTRAALQMEVLALRHPLNVLRRSVKRAKLTAADRFLWARLSRYWTGWRSARKHGN